MSEDKTQLESEFKKNFEKYNDLILNKIYISKTYLKYIIMLK